MPTIVKMNNEDWKELITEIHVKVRSLPQLVIKQNETGLLSELCVKYNLN
jgi:hypothetical protein